MFNLVMFQYRANILLLANTVINAVNKW